MFGEHPRKPIILNAWFQLLNVEVDVMIWAAISWYNFLVPWSWKSRAILLLTLWATPGP